MTHADRSIGPPVVEMFRAEGAEVLDSVGDLTTAGDVDRLVEQTGPIDVRVADFAGPRSAMPVTSMLVDPREFTDDAFQGYLDGLVWPLVRVVRAVLPQTIERRAGKIVAATSASPVRAIPGLSIYSAACGAQNAFLHREQHVLHRREMLSDPAVRESFESQLPAGRLGKGYEAAELALALATGASDFLAGQFIPISGGWAT